MNEITSEQAECIHKVEQRLMERLISDLRQLEFEDWYQFVAERFGTNDPDVKELLVILKDKDTQYYVCGGWECEVPFNALEIIALIDVPKGYENVKRYY